MFTVTMGALLLLRSSMVAIVGVSGPVELLSHAVAASTASTAMAV
jgi:hypothetical protein